jgi:hypothetical protein
MSDDSRADTCRFPKKITLIIALYIIYQFYSLSTSIYIIIKIIIFFYMSPSVFRVFTTVISVSVCVCLMGLSNVKA